MYYPTIYYEKDWLEWRRRRYNNNFYSRPLVGCIRIIRISVHVCIICNWRRLRTTLGCADLWPAFTYLCDGGSCEIIRNTERTRHARSLSHTHPLCIYIYTYKSFSGFACFLEITSVLPASQPPNRYPQLPINSLRQPSNVAQYGLNSTWCKHNELRNPNDYVDRIHPPPI